ncbi:MAG TPA: hypothetical protein VGW34_06260 [Allosphingosinicella sp.]|nr:hypothetical protein [Allosphingosinicella sp.]
MARYTERVRFSVPAEVKAEWKAKAAKRGQSLSAFLRDVTEELIAEHELDVACAEVELRITEATLQ